MNHNGKSSGTATKTPPCYRIEVASKFGHEDPGGNALAIQCQAIGLPASLSVRVSSLYEIIGPLTKHQATQISRDLLTDPITEEFRIDNTTPSPAFLIGPHWRLEVWLKPTVTDSAGESVRRAVTDLGLPRPEIVRTGKAYRIAGKVNRAQIDKLLSRLLANPVIHRTRVVEP